MDLHFLEDRLLCDHYAALDKQYKKNNERMMGEMEFVPSYYKDNKDFAQENEVLFPASNRLCDKEVVKFRGHNNVPPKNLDKRKDVFLLPISDQANTYNNSITCDERRQCCSKSHQLFMNQTRRK
jgi:hypothetical protein